MVRVLDRRITLVRVTEVNTGTGLTLVETPLGSLWASRADVGDAERVAAGSVQGTVRSSWLVRSSELARGLRPKDRVAERGLQFEILGLREMGRGNLIEITAEGKLD